MIVTEKEPFENNLQTNVKWNFKKERVNCKFTRGNKSEIIFWDEITEIFADKLSMLDSTKSWRAEIQAMTGSKFHLYVESSVSKNLILYSGILGKKNSIFQLIGYNF